MARAIITTKIGEKINLLPEGDPFFVNFSDDNNLELPQASNTRRRGQFYDRVRGLFTLDGTQDTVNEDGSITEGVKYRETITTTLRGYREDNGAYVIIPASNIALVEVEDN